MGVLIVLPRADRPARHEPLPDRSAEILFFTGVRYYRMQDSVPTETKTRRRRRRTAAAVSGEMRIDAHA